jgi:hypothetical protein
VLKASNIAQLIRNRLINVGLFKEQYGREKEDSKKIKLLIELNNTSHLANKSCYRS